MPASAKRTAIKQSILRNRTSSTPSRATKLDQVRARIQKYATGKSSTSSSKSTLDPDSSLNSLVTPETNHVTLVEAFISRSPSPIIHCIGGDHFLHYSHNDSFPWLNKPWDTSLQHYQYFPIGTVITIFDRYGYPVLFYLVTRDLSFQPDDPQTLMSAFSAFFSFTYHFDLPTLALERNNFSYDDNLLQSAYTILDHHASLNGVHFYFYQVSVASSYWYLQNRY